MPDPGSPNRSRVLIDPEADDESEQKFAASLDQRSTFPRFILDQEHEPVSVAMVQNESSYPHQCESAAPAAHISETRASADFVPGLLQTDFVGNPSASVWRQEVAARLHSYRARRKPRPPKYPSLRLRFEPAETERYSSRSSETIPADAASQPLRSEPEQGMSTRTILPQEPEAIAPEPQPAAPAMPEKARIIEFPRAYVPPVPAPDELAEPVWDRPRILEVPDVEPPPPALGGILLPTEEKEPERRRPGFEIPLQAASMPRRICAAFVDGLLVLSACTLFGYIAFRLSPFVPPLPQLAVMAVLVPGVFWSGYQYLLLVYTGSTPGLRAAHLRLSDFDGSAVPRSRRRWRVFASILSGLSLALGFAWCFLDEDALCWHDRITHTYLAPSK